MSTSHKWTVKKLTKPCHCSHCKQFNWGRNQFLCKVCGRTCHEKCAAEIDAQKIPCTAADASSHGALERTSSLSSIPSTTHRSPTPPPPSSLSISSPPSKTPRPASTSMISPLFVDDLSGTSPKPTVTVHPVTPTSTTVFTSPSTSTTIRPMSPTPQPSTCSAETTPSAPPCAPTVQVGDMGMPIAEGIFSALPVRAAAFQSGRVRLTPSTPSAEFAHPFAQRPKVCAWLMSGASGLTRIPTEQLVITASGFKITSVTANCAVNWIAYLPPATNPFLSDTIKFILATPGLTPPLLQKAEKCIEACTVNGAASDGQTLLHAAAYSGHLPLVNWLLKKNGINLDVQDERGWTPLMCAVHPGHFGVALRLLSQGASTDIINNRKHTALHLLARSYTQEKTSDEVVRILLGPGNDPNLTSETGETSLMIACSGAFNPQFVTMLLDAKADPNIPDLHGATPLYKATTANNICLAELLLKYGADPNKGPEGDTPFDRAQASGNVLFIELLERAVAQQQLREAAKAQPMTLRNKLFSSWKKNTADLGKAIQVVGTAKPERNPSGSQQVDFASALEKSECKELRNMVDTYTKAFAKNKYSQEEEAEAFGQFFTNMEEAMKVHPLWMNLQPDQFDVAQEGMRKVIFTKMYNQLFNKKELAAKDSILCKHISSLSSLVIPQNMHLREDLDMELIRAAERNLQEMDNGVTPEEKLKSILNCCKILVNILQSFGSATGADDFLPLFIYTVMRSNLPHLYSNLDFIEYFKDEKRKNTEAICFYTHLCCAAAYIETDVTEEYLLANGVAACGAPPTVTFDAPLPPCNAPAPPGVSSIPPATFSSSTPTTDSAFHPNGN
ncbi:vacuolar assembly/sorting protein VPS9 [Pelomyxa schiedti]|nr:vacuolar assembly/sorting protein VPS9 [Pelomyxa schiedti]